MPELENIARIKVPSNADPYDIIDARVPKLPGSTNMFYRGDGQWAVPDSEQSFGNHTRFVDGGNGLIALIGAPEPIVTGAFNYYDAPGNNYTGRSDNIIPLEALSKLKYGVLYHVDGTCYGGSLAGQYGGEQPIVIDTYWAADSNNDIPFTPTHDEYGVKKIYASVENIRFTKNYTGSGVKYYRFYSDNGITFTEVAPVVINTGAINTFYTVNTYNVSARLESEALRALVYGVKYRITASGYVYSGKTSAQPSPEYILNIDTVWTASPDERFYVTDNNPQGIISIAINTNAFTFSMKPNFAQQAFFFNFTNGITLTPI